MSQKSWAVRYGHPAPDEPLTSNDVIVGLLGHRSVRRYLPSPVPDETVRSLIAAAQSASTSRSLQSWSVVVVRDPHVQDRIATLSADQDFVRNAPLLLIWLADAARGARVSEHRGSAPTALGFADNTISAIIDTALAAQNAAVAAESLGLGVTFVGAIRDHPESVADVLGLPPRTFALFALAIGVPDPADTAGVKPRLPQHVVTHIDRYAPASAEDLVAYDERVQAYYREQPGARSGWIDKVVSSLKEIGIRRDQARSFSRLGLPLD